MGTSLDSVGPMIAAAYAALPAGPPAVGSADAESYAAFARAVEDQYFDLPCAVEFIAGNPYASSAEMFASIEATGVLRVYNGGSDHPFLTRTQNNMFRAVHDYWGHYGGKEQPHYSFGPKGETNAWRRHCAMFPLSARPAMTAETLGQNCWVNFGPFASLPACERPYAEQKAHTLPAELWSGLLNAA